jgi:hypothetical protein
MGESRMTLLESKISIPCMSFLYFREDMIALSDQISSVQFNQMHYNNRPVLLEYDASVLLRQQEFACSDQRSLCRVLCIEDKLLTQRANVKCESSQSE